MKKIRTGMFETNSSSVHCLVMLPDCLEQSELKIYRDKKHHLALLNFEDYEPLLTSQEGKLRYLITRLWYEDGMTEDLQESYNFEILEQTVCEYTGAKGIKLLKSEGYINHQPLDRDLPVDIYDKQSVLSFIFGKGVALKQYRD